MQSIPSYLIILTGGIVVIPTFLAIILRVSLYQKISGENAKIRNLIQFPDSVSPNFIQLLETRFRNASRNLEQVNTGALIDQLYSESKVEVFFRKWRREWVDHFCRVLPNLLLAFGLMGTFLGITINLVSLSETITQAGASGNINSLVNVLKRPLEGMGIAFITSLAGLICSALLTATNLLYNTTLAKYELISLLEDYLDNIYHPTLQGQTRLDTIVKEMSANFESFLTRFGKTVREGIESALAEKIEQLMEANLNAAALAEQVYSRLADASGTIATGATRFHESAQMFERSDFPQKLSKAVADLVTIQNSFAESTNDLVGTEGNFSGSISQLTEVTAALSESIEKTNVFNEQILNFLSRINNSQDEALEILKSNRLSEKQLSEVIDLISQQSQSTIDLISQQSQSTLEGVTETHRKVLALVVKILAEEIRKSPVEGEISSLEDDVLFKDVWDDMNSKSQKSVPNWIPYEPSEEIDADKIDWSLIDALEEIDRNSNDLLITEHD